MCSFISRQSVARRVPLALRTPARCGTVLLLSARLPSSLHNALRRASVHPRRLDNTMVVMRIAKFDAANAPDKLTFRTIQYLHSYRDASRTFPPATSAVSRCSAIIAASASCCSARTSGNFSTSPSGTAHLTLHVGHTIAARSFVVLISSRKHAVQNTSPHDVSIRGSMNSLLHIPQTGRNAIASVFT